MPPKLVPTHRRHRLSALTVINFEHGVLRMHAEKPVKDALAVIHSPDPLKLSGGKNCHAALRLGWDGSIGYSHYALALDVPAAGEVVVELAIEAPPAAPMKSTPAEIEAYVRSLHVRPSRMPDEPAAFAAWQRAWRAKLAALLMGGGLPERVPLCAEQTGSTPHAAFDLLAYRYRSRADRAGTCLISVPRASGGKFPVVLALHGHEATWGAADAGAFSAGHNDDFCAYFAERGFVVVQPATMDHTLQHEGWTLQGEWTWDAMCALDLALARPDVDVSRVAVIGLSTGAHLAMNMLALDPRVAAGVVGCVLSTWNHESTRLRVPPHCDCGIYSQLGHHLEQCDWAALAAPKPVQFQHGLKDQTFCPGADDAGIALDWNKGTMPRAEYDAMFSEIERAWRVAGAGDAVETRYHGGAHAVNNADALAWVGKALGTDVSAHTVRQ